MSALRDDTAQTEQIVCWTAPFTEVSLLTVRIGHSDALR